jgi:hypothetical protein
MVWERGAKIRTDKVPILDNRLVFERHEARGRLANQGGKKTPREKGTDTKEMAIESSRLACSIDSIRPQRRRDDREKGPSRHHGRVKFQIGQTAPKYYVPSWERPDFWE